MIAYVDTSAVVPLLIIEGATPVCQQLWEDADVVLSSRLLYVEAAAALARARRADRLTGARHRRSMEELVRVCGDLDVIEVDQQVVERAAALTARLGLRGYDAVHCASAEAVNDADLVAAAGDRQLLDAWRRLGVATVDVNADPKSAG